MTVIDLFAGPGGWDLAAHALDLDPLGIEWDDAACATRKAAGLRTVQADVAALNPNDYAPCHGLIASPPCQAFSMAGKGAGRRAIAAYEEAIRAWRHGVEPDVARLDELCDDARAHLVLEPLRWAHALKPRWIACEQVEPVLPLWEAMAGALIDQGYRTWTGVLSAEQYGVPQTRRRAILLASLDGPVTRPEPTHRRYIAPRRKDEATMGLFDAPEPERIVAAEEAHLLPWVSMFEALGWHPDLEVVTERNDSWVVKTNNSTKGGTRDGLERAVGEPARTVDSASRQWTIERPATTVNGDPRISEPGHHDSDVSGSQQANAVRVTVAEALVLQSFPPDYPVQGTKTKQFEQVGNAVPPLLAWAALRAVGAQGEALEAAA